MNEHLHDVAPPGAFSESDLGWVKAMCRRLPGYLGGLGVTEIWWCDEDDLSMLQVGGYTITKESITVGKHSILGVEYVTEYEYVVSVEVQTYSYHSGYDVDMKTLSRHNSLGEALRAIYLQEHSSAFDAAAEALYYETLAQEEA